MEPGCGVVGVIADGDAVRSATGGRGDGVRRVWASEGADGEGKAAELRAGGEVGGDCIDELLDL